MERRTFLRSSVGLIGGTALAGCLDTLGFRTQPAWRNPPVEDRPNAVYYPKTIEGMAMYGMAKADECAVALTYSYPHRFWTVTGNQKNKVTVQNENSIHLMARVWERESATVLPTNVSIELLQNGEPIDSRSLWPMLSPTMGFHYGDNISLEDGGTYTARVSIQPIQARRTGMLEGTLTETQTVTIPFEFDVDNVYDLPVQSLEEKAGQKGAPDLMDMNMEMNMPQGTAPPKSDLPGTVVGEAISGDGVFVVTVLENAPRFTEKDQFYLAISAHTPHNRVILPLMSLSATLTRNGMTVFEGQLQNAVDPKLKYHYGTAVDAIEPGDTLTITVQAPPQTARHDGYETAFIDMPDRQVNL